MSALVKLEAFTITIRRRCQAPYMVGIIGFLPTIILPEQVIPMPLRQDLCGFQHTTVVEYLNGKKTVQSATS